jgi:SHS2 domain-containing protein
VPGASGHRSVAHTADVGISAWAADLPALLEEAAAGLTDLLADIDRGAAPTAADEVTVEGRDLAGLVYAWLNELIGWAEVNAAAPVAVRVEQVLETADGWRLRARWAGVAYGDAGARPRLGVKSATYHRLAVEPTDDGWQLTAYLDV